MEMPLVVLILGCLSHHVALLRHQAKAFRVSASYYEYYALFSAFSCNLNLSFSSLALPLIHMTCHFDYNSPCEEGVGRNCS